ncbi:MAG: zinc ribbon domain-containing protein [Denitrovibrio sp.]|nr:MAG: zinc ribbon domain-containing protein [Denitrovibrio sp.]
MPIYEYKCKKCVNTFSKLVFNKDTIIECPSCKSQDVEKQISAISSTSGSSVGAGAVGGCGSSGFG